MCVFCVQDASLATLVGDAASSVIVTWERCVTVSPAIVPQTVLRTGGASAVYSVSLAD